MLRVLGLLFFLLSYEAAFGTIVVPTDYIQVTPTNATNHVVLCSYGPTNDFITVIMAYTKGELPYDSTVLECTNSVRHFSLPIECIHPAPSVGVEDVVLISFRMDRETASECVLKVRFSKGLDKAAIYIFSIKDFIPKVGALPSK
jgi:hypothetical protein